METQNDQDLEQNSVHDVVDTPEEFAEDVNSTEGVEMMFADHEPAPHSCCSRFCQEWRLPFFDLTETDDATIDVERSFAPHPFCRHFLAKAGILGWATSVLIVDLVERDPLNYYLIYITNWALIISVLYLMTSLMNTVFGVDEQRPHDEVPGFLARFSWGLYSTAATIQMFIVLLYWVLDYTPGNPVTYKNVMKHGGIMLLVFIDGRIINCVPVRLRHVVFPVTVAILFVAWSVIHAALDLGNPYKSDEDPETDDDAIYSALNWNKRFASSAITAAIAVGVLTPFLFLQVWLISIYSFPFHFDGSNRRYVYLDKKVQEQKTCSVSTEKWSQLPATMARSGSSSRGSAKGKSSALCCCPLFFAEFKLPFWSLQESNGNVIDVQASFAPQPFCRTLILKLIMFGWSVSVLIMDIMGYGENLDYYFIYLTHWGFLLALIYLLVSFLNTLFGVAEQTANDERPGFMVRLAWGLFSSAATNQLVIVALFWTLDRKSGESVSYVSTMKHGIIMVLVLIEGLIVNRIPVRAKHFLFVFLFDVLYLIWSLVHSILGLGNPFNQDPQTDDDSIYASLNWKKRPEMTAVIAVISLFVVAPLLFYVVWTLSLWACPLRFDGSNRRYYKTGADIEMGRMGSNYYSMRSA